MASAIFHARSAFHKSRKGFISLKKALAEASAFSMAEDEGFEPPQTESESGVLPLHKSSIFRDTKSHGGDNRTRTCDLMRVKHAL